MRIGVEPHRSIDDVGFLGDGDEMRAYVLAG